MSGEARRTDEAAVGALESFEVSSRKRVVKLLDGSRVACFSQLMDVRTRGAGGESRLEGARLTGVAEKRERGWVLVQTHLSMPEG